MDGFVPSDVAPETDGGCVRGVCETECKGAEDEAEGGMSEIVWQDEMPEPVRCTRMRMGCDGRWYEMRGAEDRVGWLWTCTDPECWHAIIAAAEDQ